MITELNAITPEYMKYRIKEEIEQYKQEIERLHSIIKEVRDYIKNPNIDVLTIRYNDIVNVKDELLKIIEEVD